LDRRWPNVHSNRNNRRRECNYLRRYWTHPVDPVFLQSPCFEFGRRLRLFQHGDYHNVIRPMMPLFMPRRRMDVHSALIIALLVGIAGFVPARQTVAQAVAYKVTELSAASA